MIFVFSLRNVSELLNFDSENIIFFFFKSHFHTKNSEFGVYFSLFKCLLKPNFKLRLWPHVGKIAKNTQQYAAWYRIVRIIHISGLMPTRCTRIQVDPVHLAHIVAHSKTHTQKHTVPGACASEWLICRPLTAHSVINGMCARDDGVTQSLSAPTRIGARGVIWYHIWSCTSDLRLQSSARTRIYRARR